RDEVGLVRAICVKERSSAKRKELFQQIQVRQTKDHAPSKRPVQLLLDMPIRWSSTCVMLERSEKLKDDVDTFVHEIAGAEKDRTKRQKLADLQLTSEEWSRVSILLDVLNHADKAQQSFSSDRGPSLHLALPALEALHKAWSSRAIRDKYVDFKRALEAGVDKIGDYYKKSADSDAYIISMLLDPVQKANHIRKYWGEDLYKAALSHAEE
ncbi:ribonuclease H-like domain-containing protein, partial [Hygrophoropsis aurantiaca]